MSATNLKQRIHNGEHVYGANVSMARPSREALIAKVEDGGYDFVAVDSQHSPYNEDRLVAFCDLANELENPQLIFGLNTPEMRISSETI